MAKATASDTTALSVSEAAQAIVDLINSSPRSPRIEEIAAIIRGASPAAEDTMRGDLLALSPEHIEYRRLIAEIAKLDDEGYPVGTTDEESEALLRSVSDKAMDIERRVWAKPARTLADVLLRGEMALFNENGILESLDDPDAYYCERSAAQLIRAVVDVLGGLHAR